MEFFANLKKQIASGQLKEVIEQLLTYLETRDRDFYNEVLQLSQQLATLEREHRAGTLDEQERTRRHNRISQALIEIIHALETGKKRPAIIWMQSRLLLYVSGVAALLLLVFFVLRNREKSFSLTVFVQDKYKNIVLRNEGKVVVDFNSDRRDKEINENGEAIFREIPGYLLGKEVRVFVTNADIYKASKPDSLYLLDEDGKIYVEVKTKGLDSLRGVVYDEAGFPLAGVGVSIPEVADTTDTNGRFLLRIPEHLQKRHQAVAFSKKGFNFQEHTATPETGEELRVVLKRDR